MNDDQYKRIFSENLKRYMALNNKNQIDLINDLKLNKSAVSTWCNGTRLPRMDKIEILAKYFNVNRSDLIEEHDFTNNATGGLNPCGNTAPLPAEKIPLLAGLANGELLFYGEDRESYVLAGTGIDADFCLKARGDSMIGARILDGDIVFIRKTSTVDNGEVAAVAMDDEVSLKRVYYFKDESLLMLLSENPQYPPECYKGGQLDHIRILGKAVAFQGSII